MEFSEYIDGELYIIIPVLYIIGIILKKSSFQDELIPFILGVAGIGLVTVYKLTVGIPQNTEEILKTAYEGVTQGILCAAASVYANNIFKQIKKKDSSQGESDKNSVGEADN